MLPNHKDIDKKEVTEIEQIQTTKLIELLHYVNVNSKYYNSVFKTKKINISEINSISDLQKIPVTTKDDLYVHNKDFMCVTSEKVIDYVTLLG